MMVLFAVLTNIGDFFNNHVLFFTNNLDFNFRLGLLWKSSNFKLKVAKKLLIIVSFLYLAR